ncbi:hypothetical protein SLS60_005938 [Paraconiothyrium brasiliense]|uniref:Uncharacterized protein n=1 Tax=Paraconiothyrium brasiliense TaxID=300254 RepID=A0ABR3RDU1_9PLEO
MAPNREPQPAQLAAFMSKLPNKVKSSILSETLDAHFNGANEFNTAKEKQEQTKALISAAEQVQKEPEPKPEKKQSKAEKMEDELRTTGCYATKKDGSWWVYYPDGGRMPLQRLSCSIRTWMYHDNPKYDDEGNIMPISTIYYDRPRSAFKTEEAYRNRWTPPRPPPPPEVVRSLPEGYWPNAADIRFTSEDDRRKIWGEPLQGYPDIYVKARQGQESVLVYKHFPQRALARLSTYVHRVSYGPYNMHKKDSSYTRYRSITFSGCLPGGMKMALEFVHDMYVETVAGPPRHGLGDQHYGVIMHPLNIENLHDAMNIYHAGCILGIDHYLLLLRQRICEDIVATMYQVDGKNTIQSGHFLWLAISISLIREDDISGTQDHSNDPVWKCVVVNALKLRNEGKFRDARLQDDMKKAFPQLEEAMIAFEEKEVKVKAEAVTAALARLNVSEKSKGTTSTKPRDKVVRWLEKS